MNLNKKAIKNFATEARVSLLRDIEKKLNYLKPATPNELPVKVDKGVETEDVSFNSGEKKEQRKKLIARYNQIGKDNLIKEVAYTWFNRFIAIRFMEVNGFLESNVKVFSATEKEKTEPQIVTEALNVDLPVNKDLIYRYKDENNTDELFKYLLILQCDQLSESLPFLFEKLNDYTRLLLPNNLLGKNSVINKLVNDIPEDNFKQVEIIGWLYQYYVSEKKDQAFKASNKKGDKKEKYNKDTLPAVTQFFTPDWIVKYMVENSLGKLWIESTNNINLKNELNYLIENPEHRDEVRTEYKNSFVRNDIEIESIKFLDPAMGSGHILVYAFDMFYQIYQSLGYARSQIAKKILENNLYGFDIDKRAAQLAQFAVLMRARQFDPEILEENLTMHLIEIKETNNISNIDLDKYPEIKRLIDTFYDAKILGSIIEVPNIDIKKFKDEFKKLQENQDIFIQQYIPFINDLVKQLELFMTKYDVVVTNPPYGPKNNFQKNFGDYVDNHYLETKADLFAVFMDVCSNLAKKDGLVAMINQHQWMFLKTYEKLRETFLKNNTILSMLHLGTNAFPEISGEVVQSTTFVFLNSEIRSYKGKYFRLVNFDTTKEKESAFINGECENYVRMQRNFSKIPGSPIAYWVSKNVYNIFDKGKDIEDTADITGSLNKTANNNKYVLFNWEIDRTKLFNEWVGYAKGGVIRKWYGNRDQIVDWSNSAKEFYSNNSTSNIIPQEYRFRKGITYTDLTTKGFSARFLEDKQIVDMSGPALFIENDKSRTILLGLLNTKIANLIFNILNPTFHVKINDIRRFPIIILNNKAISRNIVREVCTNICISKLEWNSRETSWDFNQNPLVKHKTDSNLIEDAYRKYTDYWREQFFTLHKNEEKLNKIFIEIYGLEDEMTPDVELDNITILEDEADINEKHLKEIKNREEIKEFKGNTANPKLKEGLHKYFTQNDKKKLLKFDHEEIIKQFVSYGVGCIMGRYSLDEEGLAFAGGDFDDKKYKIFQPDDDAIVPVLDDIYFEDDIVTRFVEFVKASFGEKRLADNLKFIAEGLGKNKNETSKEAIRKYLFKKFYKDHVKRYKKKPIYWLFTSGNEQAFNALIYLHRYNKYTVSKMRTDYLHELQGKYEMSLQQSEQQLNDAESSKEKNKLETAIKNLRKKLEEIKKYDELLKHYADKQIELDLDDGVDINYAKFEKIIAKK